MRRIVRLVVATTVAACAWAGIGGSAAADSIEVSPAGSITATSQGQLTFSDTRRSSSVACNVTLTGSLLTGPMEKVSGTPTGSVTSMTTSSCTSGRLTGLVSGLAPWPLVYTGQTGTPPSSISAYGLALDNVAFERTWPFTCLYRGAINLSLAVSGSPYRAGVLTTSGSTLRLVSGAICPADATVAGSLNLAPAQTLGDVVHKLRDISITHEIAGDDDEITLEIRNDSEGDGDKTVHIDTVTQTNETEFDLNLAPPLSCTDDDSVSWLFPCYVEVSIDAENTEERSTDVTITYDKDEFGDPRTLTIEVTAAPRDPS